MKHAQNIGILFNRFWESCHLRSKKCAVAATSARCDATAMRISRVLLVRGVSLRFCGILFRTHCRVDKSSRKPFEIAWTKNEIYIYIYNNTKIKVCLIHEVWVGCIFVEHVSSNLQHQPKATGTGRKSHLSNAFKDSCQQSRMLLQNMQNVLPPLLETQCLEAWQVPSPSRNTKWFIDVARLFMDLTFSPGRKATFMQECPVPRDLCKHIQKKTTKQQENKRYDQIFSKKEHVSVDKRHVNFDKSTHTKATLRRCRRNGQPRDLKQHSALAIWIWSCGLMGSR